MDVVLLNGKAENLNEKSPDAQQYVSIALFQRPLNPYAPLQQNIICQKLRIFHIISSNKIILNHFYLLINILLRSRCNKLFVLKLIFSCKVPKCSKKKKNILKMRI